MLLVHCAMQEPAEFLSKERAERELIRPIKDSEYAYRNVMRCLLERVRCEDVDGGVLITPMGYEVDRGKARP